MSTHAQEAHPVGKGVQQQRQLSIGSIPPPRERDYAFAWWPNAFRKEKGDNSPNMFCVESGRDAFTLAQSGHGNDFWQIDYDAESCTHKLTL